MAAAAAIAETTANSTNEEQLVTMIVDKQLFGIPILQVQDIVEATKITPVPLATSAIAGVLNLRGRIVTVIDLRKVLGNDEEVPWESQMGVTVEYKGDLYTLLVDAIGDVRSVRRSDFDKAPSTLEPETRRLCSGIYRLQGTLLVVLEVSRILTPDVIAATSVLTVADRRARKVAALENAKGDETLARQFSSRMTGLSDYDADSEIAADDQSSDDIKQRKKENRNRRPVAERWREAMEERARQTGQTIYRMREPDEETLETARDEMAAEDSAWQRRIKDGTGRRSAGSDGIPGDLGELPDEAFSDEALSDMPLLHETGSSPVSSDKATSADSLAEEMLSDESVSDEPFAGDEFAASDLAGAPADDVTPPADESAGSAEPAVADITDMPEGKPAVDGASEAVAAETTTADNPDMPVDEPVVESATVDDPDMKMDEPVADDALEPSDDTAAAPEMPEDNDAPEQVTDDATDNDKSGKLSGLWNKLRSSDKTAAAEELPSADEAAMFDEIPAVDEVPISDGDMISGDEPIAKDEPKPARKSAKPAGKKKKRVAKKKAPAAKKKAPAKGKPAKSSKA